MSRSVDTLFEPGHEAEWKRLGAEKRALLTEDVDFLVPDDSANDRRVLDAFDS